MLPGPAKWQGTAAVHDAGARKLNTLRFMDRGQVRKERGASHALWVGLGILTEPIRALINAHRLRGTRRPTKPERFKVPMRDAIIAGASHEPEIGKWAWSPGFSRRGLGKTATLWRDRLIRIE
jgi:hypothetical protein